MEFQSPDSSISVDRHSDAFVDDTQNGLNDAHMLQPWTIHELFEKLQAMAQTWERLLHCSGGALELSKCSYYVLYWQWIHGLPSLISKQKVQEKVGSIALTLGLNSNKTPIKQLDTSEAHKTLGVWLAPDGSEAAQINYLLTKSHQVATLISQSKLTRLEAYMAYHLCWIPAVSYSFGITTIPNKALVSIQSHPTMAFLQKMGFNRNFPRAVAVGPRDMGGLALRNLPIEQGIARIINILKHVYNRTETGKLILIALNFLQRDAGTAQHLLVDPIPRLTYLSQCWLSALRDFLRMHQTQLHIREAWNFRESRVNDVFLMDTFRKSSMFSNTELYNLNLVRIFLNVATLSDITSADGNSIDRHAFQASKLPNRTSHYLWPRQPEITIFQRRLWTRALRSQFTRDPYNITTSSTARHLVNPLKRWHALPNQSGSIIITQSPIS
jgi:hypothetical protein